MPSPRLILGSPFKGDTWHELMLQMIGGTMPQITDATCKWSEGMQRKRKAHAEIIAYMERLENMSPGEEEFQESCRVARERRGLPPCVYPMPEAPVEIIAGPSQPTPHTQSAQDEERRLISTPTQEQAILVTGAGIHPPVAVEQAFSVHGNIPRGNEQEAADVSLASTTYEDGGSLYAYDSGTIFEDGGTIQSHDSIPTDRTPTPTGSSMYRLPELSFTGSALGLSFDSLETIADPGPTQVVLIASSSTTSLPISTNGTISSAGYASDTEDLETVEEERGGVSGRKSSERRNGLFQLHQMSADRDRQPKRAHAPGRYWIPHVRASAASSAGERACGPGG
ncbi:hypothetical protein DACRYDRAFT_116464 [Dacryopinax primogenitus]|uniref:Uncharacterized protein n=1 Tax=Dacryopinax primogenitus (strain DJM 731) TaxID=1858805 RepID=M5FZF5_DACPD|nr:uncharacterized protein DACRYDRAFT_116464 [Dacryopinax primogenitus]EJU01250.1 hypothetical protein DACRYDRAFT_116464 [Dacryopinax primogenitus]